MSVLSASNAKRVEDLLVRRKLISADELEKVRTRAQKKGESLLSILVGEQIISNEELVKAIAKVSDVPYVNLLNAHVKPEILDLLSKDIAARYMAVPLGQMQNRLVVAMLDADNVQAVDFLASKIGRPIKVYLASEEGINNVLKQYGANIDKDVAQVLITTPLVEKDSGAEKGTIDTSKEKNIKTIVQDSPISKALSAILEYAANNRASDVHIESMEKNLRIRARIDGIMREIMRLPKSTEAPLVSRIKILSNLKIDEHRIPQDGQFTVKVSGREIDLRIAISPVVWGEQVIIRLLDKSGTSLQLESLGYVGRPLRLLRSGLKRPNGMVLTSGPTGSGKSTSLYAMIQEIKNDAINIVTLEDPVEYKIEGVNQIQVNPDVGLTFATGLRSILRQDPDVIMVGEIRDQETAQLAVQAALTGHLVFSTLHTNSAAGILPRLLDMGIEPFLIASTVHTVIGQRLVRRIGEAKENYQSEKAETEAIRQGLKDLLPKTAPEKAKAEQDLGYNNLPLASQNAYTLYRGKDVPDAPGGYRGRMGIYEVFEVTDKIQELIMKRATSSEIQKSAVTEGMITMRQDGYMKALSGQTTLTEVNRVTAADMA